MLLALWLQNYVKVVYPILAVGTSVCRAAVLLKPILLLRVGALQSHMLLKEDII